MRRIEQENSPMLQVQKARGSKKMTKTMVFERRRGRRFEAQWRVVVKGSDSRGLAFEEAGSLSNLSSSGVFFYIDRSVPVGARLDISIRIPLKKENWMRYSAEVVRTEVETSRVGLAARFDSMVPSFRPDQPK